MWSFTEAGTEWGCADRAGEGSEPNEYGGGPHILALTTYTLHNPSSPHAHCPTRIYTDDHLHDNPVSTYSTTLFALTTTIIETPSRTLHPRLHPQLHLTPSIHPPPPLLTDTGTWWYGRGNWCDGMDVKPLVVDVTTAALSGQGTVEVTPLDSDG